MDTTKPFPRDRLDSCDPCLLPLAARRALFEKFGQSVVKSDENHYVKKDENLLESDANDSIGSNYSLLFSSGDENIATVSQSTEIYPELPEFDVNIHKTQPKEDEIQTQGLISPIKSYKTQSIIKSPTKDLNDLPTIKSPIKNFDDQLLVKSPAKIPDDLSMIKSPIKNFDDQLMIKIPIKSSDDQFLMRSPIKNLNSLSMIKSPTKSVDNQLIIKSPAKNCDSRSMIKSPINNFDDLPRTNSSIKNPDDQFIIKSSIKRNESLKSIMKSPQKTPVKSEPARPSTPLRTLSMYRREQTIRKSFKRSADDEDDLMTDLEAEAQKRYAMKKYSEDKSAKMEELRIEADKYNKIIYQSFRALDLCVTTHNISERIEAEKILLINLAKKNACVDELYRLQKEETFDITEDPVGKICFNRLTLLVKGNFFVSQASGLDLCEYHFICIFTCGDRVISTDALSSSHAIQEASLNFTNKAEFDHLRKDFHIRLVLYALALPKGKRIQDKKIRLTPKNKSKVKYTHSSALQASPRNEKIKSNFKKIGYVDFTHDNIMRSRFQLEDFMYESPLEDQIMIDSMIGGEYISKFSSYLSFHEISGDYPVWNRRWCVLSGPCIYFWRFSEDEGGKQPMGMINLKQCVNPTINKATTEICMRPHSFSFLILEKQNNSLVPFKYLVAADIRKERDCWLANLNKVLGMIRLWEPDCFQPMDQASLDRLLK